MLADGLLQALGREVVLFDEQLQARCTLVDVFAVYNYQMLFVAEGKVVWAENRRRSNNTRSAYGNH